MGFIGTFTKTAVGWTRHLQMRQHHLYRANRNLHYISKPAGFCRELSNDRTSTGTTTQVHHTNSPRHAVKMAFDTTAVYEHKAAKGIQLRTTNCFDEAMQSTNPKEIYFYYPQNLNYEVQDEPYVTSQDFYDWGIKDNRFSAHNLEVGTRYEGHRMFNMLEYPLKLFAHKHFITTFTMDSIIDEIAQTVELNPGIEERNFLKLISNQLANEVRADHAHNIYLPSYEETHPRIFERIEKFMSCYNDLTVEGELLFGSKFMIRLKELWARFILGMASEVLHKVDQQAKGSVINPYFWSAIRPDAGGLTLTGSLMYGTEPHYPPLDDSLEHAIHMMDAYDNEILSFHKEQSQTNFNLLNATINLGLPREGVFMMWMQMRNQHCRNVELLVEASSGKPYETCYRRVFRYQMDLFNYHMWSYHRYGWNRVLDNDQTENIITR